MEDKILFQKTYEINSFLVNSQGKLGLYALLNLIQDVAWGHANILGIGNEEFASKEMFWVLTRQKLEMQYWPKWGESIEIHTWVRPGVGLFALREFEIYHNAKKIGECSTDWVALSLKTRRFANFDSESVFEKYKLDKTLDVKAKKIAPFEESSYISEYNVRNSDIDTNQHVNNTNYAKWILDSIESNLHKEYKLRAYEVNFLSETKLGDQIEILEKTPKVEGDFFYQGKRKEDGKIVFTANLVAIKA